MKEHVGGAKRSSWLIFKRRLTLIRLLLRQEWRKSELIAAINREMAAHGEEGYIGDGFDAFKNDCDALKAEFACEIVFERRAQTYALQSIGQLSLLDLPDEALEGLRFLEATFQHGDEITEFASVRALLDQVTQLLPTERRTSVTNAKRHAVRLQLAVQDGVDPGVFRRVRRAINAARELRFDYRSNNPEHPVVQHRVAPYEIFLQPNGHCYLDATLLEATPRSEQTITFRSAKYRLSRMIAESVQVLPTMLPPIRPQPPTYTVRYWLHPNVARRRDVAARFPNTSFAYHDDGSALVTATISDLWQARQVLLSYGSACRVLDPPELVELFKKAIRELSELYAQ